MNYPLPTKLSTRNVIPAAEYISVPEYRSIQVFYLEKPKLLGAFDFFGGRPVISRQDLFFKATTSRRILFNPIPPPKMNYPLPNKLCLKQSPAYISVPEYQHQEIEAGPWTFGCLSPQTRAEIVAGIVFIEIAAGLAALIAQRNRRK